MNNDVATAQCLQHHLYLLLLGEGLEPRTFWGSLGGPVGVDCTLGRIHIQQCAQWVVVFTLTTKAGAALGLHLDVEYADAVSLATCLRFGLVYPARAMLQEGLLC